MLNYVERGIIRSEIKLSDPAAGPRGNSHDVQVLRVGKFNHPRYGDFEVTRAVLAEMKRNFDAKIRGVDIAFDYFHKSDEEASGWPTELYLLSEGEELWAKVDWTKAARQKLDDREVRYFSPDFAFKWKDPESGVVYKNVLFGGGLTNRPFVKDMAAIVASEQQGDDMDIKELEAKFLKLSEEHAAMKSEHADMKKKLEEKPAPVAPVKKEGEEDDGDDSVEGLKKKLAEAQKKLAEYEEKNKKLEEAKQMAEKETAFNLLLSEGKACAAQKDSYMKGDMPGFIKLAQPVNLKPNGSEANGGDGTGDRDDRVLKLAEEKQKADPKLSKIDAITLANAEVK